MLERIQSVSDQLEMKSPATRLAVSNRWYALSIVASGCNKERRSLVRRLNERKGFPLAKLPRRRTGDRRSLIISLQRNVVATSFTVMEVPRDPAASRYEHVGKGLRRSDLNRDPVKQFGNWFTAAIEAGIRDVNAMSLATAGSRWRDRQCELFC